MLYIIPKIRQVNYHKTIARDAGTSKDRFRKVSHHIFRTKSTARLRSRVERTSQLLCGEPATVSGLLTQEVLILWCSQVLARPLDLLGEALTNPISVPFPSCSQKVEVKATFLRRHEHGLHAASTPKEVSGALVLLLPHLRSERAWLLLGRRKGSCCASQTHLRANKLTETSKWPAQEKHQKCRLFFCGEVGPF